MSFGRDVRPAFALQPGMAFLNHGSYGATPRVVLAAQRALQDEMEAQPIRFMLDAPQRIREAATRLAVTLGAEPDGLCFVENATLGVNTVLRHFEWGPSDVVLTTSHRYNAVRLSLQYLADRYGVRVHTVEVPFPASGPEEVVHAIRTSWPSDPVKLCVFDQITSVTGVVWPVAEMIEIAKEHGTQTLIDGAHVPGQLALDLARLGADYWVGNCHKWLYAPKGCAVLYVASPHRGVLHPLIISHGYGEGLTEEFDWVGTRDPSAWLATETALDFVKAQGGEEAIRSYNRSLRAWAGDLLESELGLTRAAPPSMLANLESRRLPPELGEDPWALSRRMWERDAVEAMIAPQDGALWLRLSAQIYNTQEDYQRLVDSLRVELGR